MTERGLDVIEADDDIFEINDFTVVTKLEGFVISLESILQNACVWPSEVEITQAIDSNSLKVIFLLWRLYIIILAIIIYNF